MKISIIYHLSQNTENLKNSLDSLFKIMNPNVELILIDDCCSNEVSEIYLGYDLTAKNIKVIQFYEEMEFSYSMNFGLKKAKGDYIYFAGHKVSFDKDFFKNFEAIIKGKKTYDLITFNPSLASNIVEQGEGWEYQNKGETWNPEFVVNSRLSVKHRIFNTSFLKTKNILFEEFKNYHSLFVFDVLINSNLIYVLNKPMVDSLKPTKKQFAYNLYDILYSGEILWNKIDSANMEEERRDAYLTWVSILILSEFLKKIFISYGDNKKIVGKSVANALEIIEKIYPLYKSNKYLPLIKEKKIANLIMNFKCDLNFIKQNLF